MCVCVFDGHGHRHDIDFPCFFLQNLGFVDFGLLLLFFCFIEIDAWPVIRKSNDRIVAPTNMTKIIWTDIYIFDIFDICFYFNCVYHM